MRRHRIQPALHERRDESGLAALRRSCAVCGSRPAREGTQGRHDPHPRSPWGAPARAALGRRASGACASPVDRLPSSRSPRRCSPIPAAAGEACTGLGSGWAACLPPPHESADSLPGIAQWTELQVFYPASRWFEPAYQDEGRPPRRAVERVWRCGQPRFCCVGWFLTEMVCGGLRASVLVIVREEVDVEAPADDPGAPLRYTAPPAMLSKLIGSPLWGSVESRRSAFVAPT